MSLKINDSSGLSAIKHTAIANYIIEYNSSQLIVGTPKKRHAPL